MRRVCFGCVVRGASGVGFTCDVKFSSGSSVFLILRAFDSVLLGAYRHVIPACLSLLSTHSSPSFMNLVRKYEIVSLHLRTMRSLS
jgi:hypothetical protein